MLKMSVSPETSSEHGDVEIAGETFGSSKMSISLQTSSKINVEVADVRHLWGGALGGPPR